MSKEDCIFCKLANSVIPVDHLYEDEKVKVIFDAFPANKGHVIIIPKNHVQNIYEIEEDLAAHIFKVASKVALAIKKSLNCDGINILQNNEAVAGQTVFHFHLHIIPRFENDKVNISWEQAEASSEYIKNMKEIINI